VQTTKRRFRTVVITGGSAGVGRVTATRLELLNEVIPSLHRAGVLLIRDSEINGPSMKLMEERGKALGVELAVFEAQSPVEFEGAFARWTNGKIGAVRGETSSALNRPSGAKPAKLVDRRPRPRPRKAARAVINWTDSRNHKCRWFNCVFFGFLPLSLANTHQRPFTARSRIGSRCVSRAKERRGSLERDRGWQEWRRDR
jgi:hypothetical protein